MGIEVILLAVAIALFALGHSAIGTVLLVLGLVVLAVEAVLFVFIGKQVFLAFRWVFRRGESPDSSR